MANEEKYILVSLEEDKAKDLANVISNTTSRKILDYLSTKEEASETEISKELNLPLSTIHYNLQQLKKNNLVETKHFMYSDKGKKIEFYRVVKKFIVIAPKYSSSLLKNMLPLFLISAFVAWLIQLFNKVSYKTVSFSQTNLDKIPGQGAASQVAQESINKTIEITKTIPIETNYGVWFLFGSWFILIVYMLIQSIRKKNN